MSANLFLGLLIVATVGLNTIAQTLLKLGSGHNLLNLYLLGGLFAYGLSTVVYISVLGRFNLSVAYPVVIGLTVIAATMTGALFFREKVAIEQWIGIGLMFSGIMAIASKQIS